MGLTTHYHGVHRDRLQQEEEMAKFPASEVDKGKADKERLEA